MVGLLAKLAWCRLYIGFACGGAGKFRWFWNWCHWQIFSVE